MADGAGGYTISKVLSAQAQEAYDFHESVAASDEHIWPRNRDQIQRYADVGRLFSARDENAQLVGLCYVVPEPDDDGKESEIKEWEVGGITVPENLQRRGIGTAMTRLALAHTLLFYSPWASGQTIIAYVHVDNDAPRKLLEYLGFEHMDRVEIPGDKAPASMKRNASGNLEGDKFRFTEDGLKRLSDWFSNRLAGSGMTIDLGYIDGARLADSLKQLADAY